jgi:endonuclease/exonuclease/phosphatase (EEP) superfamily protein YafD
MFSIFWPVKLAIGLFKFFLGFLVFLTCVYTVMALMGDKGWLCSLTTHFRVQYLIIQSIALVLTGLRLWNKHRNYQPIGRMAKLNVLVLALFVGINGWAILPYYLPAPNANQPSQGHVRLMHCNLFGLLNQHTDYVIDAIKDNQPDILDLVEYTSTWQEKLERSGILKAYPYHLLAGHGHIGLYSKIPLRNTRLVFTSPSRKVSNHANLLATFNLGGSPVTLLVAHPASPVRPSHLEWLKQSFGVWEQERPNLGENLVIVGDLNTSPWSVEFNQLIKRTGLRDSQLGFGLQPSWPMWIPLPDDRRMPTWVARSLTIPIDHVLVSPRIKVLARRTGPFDGSDHLPVIIDLAITPNTKPAVH